MQGNQEFEGFVVGKFFGDGEMQRIVFENRKRERSLGY